MQRSLEPRVRVVDAVWLAREPVTFRELCERAVPPETRLLVLDLDRTLHLGRNMGELLGWEISAFRGYGPEYLTRLEPRRAPGRWFVRASRPLGALRYLWRAVRVWAPPGLFYLLWCKLAARIALLRRRSYLRFGPEPVHAVQRIPQDVLFKQMAPLPDALVRELSARVWARHRCDLVVEAEDVAWLRARCPGLRVVLSSASPVQVVETAAAALGVDDAIGSVPGQINGGRAKLETLRRRFPELLDAPSVTSVGISDTGYGEDHCWSEAFTHVVDVNSTSGFPPIVPAHAAVRAIFSAEVLTRAEKDARARGERWLDPRRRRQRLAAGVAELGARELDLLLAPIRAVVERLAGAAADLDRRERELAAGLERRLSEAAFAVARELERSRRLLDREALSAPRR